MHLCRSSSNVTRLPSFLEMLQNPHVLLTFDKVHNPLRLPGETTSERPKVVRTPGAFNILTSKCASRHNGVHFFDISISKSGPSMVCFVHFDLDMRFAPQRRAFFLTSQLPKVVRSWCVLYILTSKCASRNFVPQRREIVHLWPAGSAPAALASLLFGPPEPHIIGKTQCFATFLPFRAPASTFF